MATYSEKRKTDKINAICKKVSNGSALRNVLMASNMPSSSTFYKWIDADETKAKQYARACGERADVIFDEMFEIADNTIEGTVIETDDHGRTKEKKGDMLGHRRLQIDTRKWALSKLNPKKYGDKLEVDQTVTVKEQPLFPDV